jgi:2-C-methyl-D-erythritol 4-phosphate cytidylyltransferase/2-C-methyl-D-erythritol 2,4-cyclodiphosphate synthase
VAIKGAAKMSVSVLIVAAGRGSRAASHNRLIAKQYFPIGGQPVLTRTIGAFTAHARIDQVIVAIHPDDTALYERAAGPSVDRLRPPVIGGEFRQDSVRAGLEALASDPPDHVLVHDAARPFVSADLINRVVEALEHHVAVVPCLPVTDTLRFVAEGRLAGAVDRHSLMLSQTPQGFRFDAILAAHRAAAEAGKRDFTDDAGLAEWFGLEVAMVEGSETNRKLTTTQDIEAADELLRLRQAQAAGTLRVGSGYDVHAFGPGDAVILCGVHIPHGKALTGHSDADVGLHALTDAILGTLAEGDIGVHFPPSDVRWRGASSDIFLKHAADRLEARGGEIVHADITFICEAPRISPHRDAMRARVAAILGLDLPRVSVKATTNEGLGFIGRGEGIAAMATVTVRLP